MRTMAVVWAVTASAFFGPFVWAGPVHDHILDQSQESANYGYAVGGSTMMAQTFTPDSDGVLCHIQIGNTTGVPWGSLWNLGEPSPPVVEIWSTNSDGRPSSIIGTASATPGYPVPYYDDMKDCWITPNTSELDWTSLIDFSVPVKAGTMYSIVLWADEHTGAVSVGATKVEDDSYAGGALWASFDNAATWQSLSVGISSGRTPIYDMQFRTYVVPLPAGVLLGLCAVSVAGWHLRRQRA